MRATFLASFLLFFAAVAWADETTLTAKNIQGEYILKSINEIHDLRLELNNKGARLQINQEKRVSRCSGEYSFDERKALLQAQITQCGPEKQTYQLTIFLYGQYLETLQNATHVLATVNIGDEENEPVPFTIEKTR